MTNFSNCNTRKLFLVEIQQKQPLQPKIKPDSNAVKKLQFLTAANDSRHPGQYREKAAL